MTTLNDGKMGLSMATALVVGNMIGSGIFLLPSALAPFGKNAIYGWLLTTAGVLCLASVLAILSVRIKGGPFAYVEQTFGPAAGFLVMWAYLVGCWTGLPAIAIAGVSYLSRIEPALGWTSAGFTKPLRLVLESVMRPRRELETVREGGLVRSVSYSGEVPHLFDTTLYRQTRRGALAGARVARRIQSGSIRAYAAYLLGLLLAMLLLVRVGAIG